MKKVLEDELMSLAHRILKLRNRADIHELKEETSILYEKLSILSFAEKHFEGLKPTIKKHDIEQSIQNEFYLEHTSNLNYPDGTEYNDEPISEHNTEKIKDIVSQMPFETQQVDELFNKPIDTVLKEKESRKTKDEAEYKEETKDNKVVDLEDFGVHFDDLPSFEPAKENDDEKNDIDAETAENNIIEEAPTDISITENASTEDTLIEDEQSEKIEKEQEQPKQQRTIDLFSQNKKSLNDSLNDGLKIGLNDRLSFVNQLFNGDTKTYENFIEDINAMNSLEEVKEFLNFQIQDKYSYWKDKEDVANRLLYLIEKKFE